MISRAELTCRLKGHLWQAAGKTPDPNTPGGQFLVHRRCFRCGKYERLTRQAVVFVPKEN